MLVDTRLRKKNTATSIAAAVILLTSVFASAILASSSLLATAHEPAEGPNLLLNGNFEEWETRTDTYQTACGICSPTQFSQTDTVLMPKHWFAEIVHSCCVFPELGNAVLQGEVNTGSFGLQLGGFSGLQSQTGINLFQEVEVVSGLPYVASFDTKNPFPNDFGARRMLGIWLDSNGNIIGSAFFVNAFPTSFPPPSSYVHKQSPTIFAPCNAEKIKIRFDKADFGGITYDDGYFGQKLGVQPNSCPVMIDIKPGSHPNTINLKSKGVIPVAVLSTSTFNAPQLLDPSTFTFEDANTVKSAVEDVNADDLTDLVLFFRTQDTDIACGQTSGGLNGERFDGGLVAGTDSIVIVGC